MKAYRRMLTSRYLDRLRQLPIDGLGVERTPVINSADEFAERLTKRAEPSFEASGGIFG